MVGYTTEQTVSLSPDRTQKTEVTTPAIELQRAEEVLTFFHNSPKIMAKLNGQVAPYTRVRNSVVKEADGMIIAGSRQE